MAKAKEKTQNKNMVNRIQEAIFAENEAKLNVSGSDYAQAQHAVRTGEPLILAKGSFKYRGKEFSAGDEVVLVDNERTSKILQSRNLVFMTKERYKEAQEAQEILQYHKDELREPIRLWNVAVSERKKAFNELAMIEAKYKLAQQDLQDAQSRLNSVSDILDRKLSEGNF